MINCDQLTLGRNEPPNLRTGCDVDDVVADELDDELPDTLLGTDFGID